MQPGRTKESKEERKGTCTPVGELKERFLGLGTHLPDGEISWDRGERANRQDRGDCMDLSWQAPQSFLLSRDVCGAVVLEPRVWSVGTGRRLHSCRETAWKGRRDEHKGLHNCPCLWKKSGMPLLPPLPTSPLSTSWRRRGSGLSRLVCPACHPLPQASV